MAGLASKGFGLDLSRLMNNFVSDFLKTFFLHFPLFSDQLVDCPKLSLIFYLGLLALGFKLLPYFRF